MPHHRLTSRLCGGVLVLCSLMSGTAPAAGGPAPGRAAVPSTLPAPGESCYQGKQELHTAVAPARARQRPVTLASLVGSLSPGGPVPRPTLSRPRKAIRDLAALDQLADLEVARYTNETRELLLIGPAAAPGQGLRWDDWRVIVRAMVLQGAPGVSIDPGPTAERMVVRYIGGIEQTAVGATFFIADWWLKVLSTGFDNRTCARVTLGLPLPTELELMAATMQQQRTVGSPQWHRMWFEPAPTSVEVSEDGRAMRVPAQRLIVQEEALSGPSGVSSSAQAFAQSASRALPELTTRIPALAALHRLAALVQLVKWMIDKEIPLDQRWLEGMPAKVATPQTTPAITAINTLHDATALMRVGIYGGVDFHKANSYGREDGALTRVLHTAVQNAPRDATAWGFTYEGRPYQATRLQYDKPVLLRRTGTP